MKNPLKRIGITVAATAALSVVIPMSSAAAVDRTDCGNRTDLVKIYNYNRTGTLCFANAGSQSVEIYGVDEVDAGNNEVDVTFDGGSIQHVERGGSIVQVDGERTITKITVY